jgi:hypothetical protein
MDDMMKTVTDIVTRENGSFLSKDSPEWLVQRERWRRQLLLALQEDEGRRQLPSLHVLACLHAAFRWNKERQFEGNDFFDFHHAAAAIGYCQAYQIAPSNVHDPLGSIVTEIAGAPALKAGGHALALVWSLPGTRCYPRVLRSRSSAG